MGNSSQMRAPANYSRVDLRDPAEAEYWLIVLDATRQQIEAAIAASGDDAREVRAYFRRLRSNVGPAAAIR
jgi:hypothetical protein